MNTNVETQDDNRDLLADFDHAFEEEQDRIEALSVFERNRELGAPSWIGLDLSDVEPETVIAQVIEPDEVVEIEIDLSVLDEFEDFLDAEVFHV